MLPLQSGASVATPQQAVFNPQMALSSPNPQQTQNLQQMPTGLQGTNFVASNPQFANFQAASSQLANGQAMFVQPQQQSPPMDRQNVELAQSPAQPGLQATV